MVITTFTIAHFGKLKNLRVPLKDRLNILTGENESGKTTIAAFLKGMLYGIPKTSMTYQRYRPYDNDGVYGGSMEIKVNEDQYLIERSFIDGTLSVIKLPEHTPVDAESFMQDLVSEVTEETYESTGFLSQEAFRRDDDKWRVTEEKTALEKKEASIRARFMKAYDSLLTKRTALKEKLDPRVSEAFGAAEAAYEENQGKISELTSGIPEKELYIKTETEKLQKEAEEAEEKNRLKDESYRAETKKRKEALEEEVAAQATVVSKRKYSGIIPLILGILIGAGAGVYGYLNGFSTEKGLVLPVLILGIVAFLCLTGFGIVQLVINQKEAKKFNVLKNRREALKKEVDEAEEAYRWYTEHREEEDLKVENREERENGLKELSEKIEADKAELSERTARADMLLAALKAAEEKKEEQDQLKTDLEAVTAAMKAIEKAGKLNDLDDTISESATMYLSKLNMDTEEKISVAPEQMIRVSHQGMELPVEQLSTAAAQEVLLAVRLSMLDDKDPEKTLPVILDDVFANFDSDRLSAGMKLLRSLDRQVVLLTCQTRERKAL